MRAQRVIAKLADLATGDERSPLFGAGNAGVVARGGRLFRRDDEAAARAMPISSPALAWRRSTPAARAPPIRRRRRTMRMHAHGAVFAEVKVDPDLGQVRVTRLVGAFAAGRIINPRLVRSQIYGGMIWGVSFALHEQAEHGPALRPDHQCQPRANTTSR